MAMKRVRIEFCVDDSTYDDVVSMAVKAMHDTLYENCNDVLPHAPDGDDTDYVNFTVKTLWAKPSPDQAERDAEADRSRRMDEHMKKFARAKAMCDSGLVLTSQQVIDFCNDVAARVNTVSVPGKNLYFIGNSMDGYSSEIYGVLVVDPERTAVEHQPVLKYRNTGVTFETGDGTYEYRYVR